jgi:lipopolysaccharide/colanic/teichoic acid biosynthesis glycosyltransferase
MESVSPVRRNRLLQVICITISASRTCACWFRCTIFILISRWSFMTTLSIRSDVLKQQLSGSNPFCYTLKWRQKQLLLNLSQGVQTHHLQSLENQQLLMLCLQRSPVRLVKLALELSEADLEWWANACNKAGKPVFVKVPSSPEIPKKKHKVKWRLKRIVDWHAAALLLLMLLPILLVLALLILIQSPGPILFYQWRVGERGKLFRILKFRTMIVGAEELHHQIMGNQPGLHKCKLDPRITPIGCWMRKYSLDELPQLINVLRGEMSLVGPRPWALYDAVRINPEGRYRLNALPGITGQWQIAERSNLRDIAAVNQIDIDYLRSWSLWQDSRILLHTIPKVLSAFGAY